MMGAEHCGPSRLGRALVLVGNLFNRPELDVVVAILAAGERTETILT